MRSCGVRWSIYLLDDPLNAVDTNVARHLFEQCVLGHLNGSTVVLITHQQQFLQMVDQIVILEKGEIRAVGTYQSLLKTGLDFVTILGKAGKEDEEQKNQDSCRKSPTEIIQKSLQSVDDSIPKNIIKERQESGGIGLELYKKYFQAGGGLLAFLTIMSCSFLAQILVSGGDYFLTYW